MQATKQSLLLGLLIISLSLSWVRAEEHSKVLLQNGPLLKNTQWSQSKNGEKQHISLHLKELTLTSAPYIKEKINHSFAKDFQVVGLKGFQNTKQRGRPALPFKKFFIKGDLHEDDLKIHLGEEKLIEGIIPYPAQSPPCRCPKDKSLKFEIEEQAYGKDQKQETTVYKISYLGDFRGEKIYTLSLRPVLYFAETQQLKAYPNLKISLMSSEKKLKVLSLTDLKKDFSTTQKLKFTKEQKVFNLYSGGDFLKAMDPWIEFKQSQGYKINYFQVKGLSFLELKNLIEKHYKNEPFQYALILGHQGLVPAKLAETENSYETPTDLDYFTFGGPKDFIPEVYYGRFVVETQEEVESYVSKIMAYEGQRELIRSKENQSLRVLGIASNEGENPSDKEYIKRFQGPFIEKEAINNQITEGEQTSTPHKINEYLASGVHWLNYIGHGSGGAWESVGFQSSEPYQVNHLEQYEPHMIKPIVIDVACQNGRFDYKESLGEKFMTLKTNQEESGAVAYFGGSVDISWHPPAIMAEGISKNRFNPQVQSLGELIWLGQLYLGENYDDKTQITDNYTWFHLFGDPSLSVK